MPNNKQPQTKGVINPLDKELISKQEETVDVEKVYSEGDKTYLTYLQRRLTMSHNSKNQRWEELNGKSYWQTYEDNERIANTRLPEKKNDDDVIISAGTVEAKLDSILSNINNLNLSPEIHAFDRENNRLNELGQALEDVVFLTTEKDGGDESGDEEKRMLRQRELLKQGTVFVQEEWLRLFETKKKLSSKYNGEFKGWGENWTSKQELVYEGPSRTLLHGPNVYLGNITEFSMEKQPYIFVVIQMDYEKAREKYGHFENWTHVKKGQVPNTVTNNDEKTIYDNQWRLGDIKDNQVEIILYQDQPNDEFQIIINGMLMLPIGFPLSAVTPDGKYNIQKQVFRVLSMKFAYGKSFVGAGAVKEVSALIDEMLKLFVLKTRKSFSPPYVNSSGKVISRRVLSPGRISMGFAADALQKIGEEGQGVTSSEFSVLKELQDQVDKSTISPQFQGQQGQRQQTATETLELQRQAKLTLGLTIASCTLLEKKLTYLRLWNILENWMNPIDKRIITVNDVREEINSFRGTNRETNLEGEGLGERQVVVTDGEIPSSRTIRALERDEEELTGTPVRKIFLQPKGLKAAKVTWYVTVSSKEKESNAFFKLLFREQLNDMLTLMQLGSVPNLEGLEDQFARTWDGNRKKLFSKSAPAAPEGTDPSAIQGRANGAGTPALNNVPSAE